MNNPFRPKLNTWDQLVYDTLSGTVRPADRVYSPFSDEGNPSANERLLGGLGRTYTILPKDLRMGEDEVNALLNQAIGSYQSHSMQKVRRVEEGKWYYDDKLVQNSFEQHLTQATGGQLTLGKSYDREAYDATQELVKAEREMDEAQRRQAEQQAQQQAEAEAARKAAEERTRQLKQFKASHESGNLQSGGDAPTVVSGGTAAASESGALDRGSGGGRKRRSAGLSQVLGL